MVMMATPRQASISQKRMRGAVRGAVSGIAVSGVAVVNGKLLWLNGANYATLPCGFV